MPPREAPPAHLLQKSKGSANVRKSPTSKQTPGSPAKKQRTAVVLQQVAPMDMPDDLLSEVNRTERDPQRKTQLEERAKVMRASWKPMDVLLSRYATPEDRAVGEEMMKRIKLDEDNLRKAEAEAEEKRKSAAMAAPKSTAPVLPKYKIAVETTPVEIGRAHV